MDSTLLQGLMQNSYIKYILDVAEFSAETANNSAIPTNYCTVSSVPFTNAFKHIQYKEIFWVPTHAVEFSKAFQHVYRSFSMGSSYKEGFSDIFNMDRRISQYVPTYAVQFVSTFYHVQCTSTHCE
jgi:hypothetical protein